MANRAFVIIDNIVGGASTMQASGILNWIGENPDPSGTPLRITTPEISSTASWAQVVIAVTQATVAYYATRNLAIQERDVSVSDFR